MTCKFKVGDKVVFKNSSVIPRIEYEVVRVSDGSFAILYDSVLVVYPEREDEFFELVPPPKDVYYGTINFTALEARLKHLSEGGKLLHDWGIYGKHIVYMNPQGNVIYSISTNTDAFSTFNICVNILHGHGDWYIYEEPNTHECSSCNGKGTISSPKELTPI